MVSSGLDEGLLEGRGRMRLVDDEEPAFAIGFEGASLGRASWKSPACARRDLTIGISRGV